ncbi:DUF1801 domain-containing protein [Aliiroseovarius lamellibrachiae]|uniref:DUF1801 domain-containing protein n=1 Tax=Aliiroseovarius lamellibrachiae TaxID=1924933 RepID=UPI001BE0068F|nr:DUF1801 domain-containing protein [Aliiroseovarius lamellibrachiae]MBT2130175.1 DUF1801 domain-containing protein [Aliiroseovarius lamellibrachiae]
MTPKPPAPPKDVARAFEDLPPDVQDPLGDLRQLIFETAANTPGVGPITETLKWGQPSYLTEKTKAGSTLRLGCPKSGGFAIFTHCQTSIMSDFQALFPNDFTFDGNRAVVFSAGDDLPLEKLRFLISRALTYHLK